MRDEGRLRVILQVYLTSPAIHLLLAVSSKHLEYPQFKSRPALLLHRLSRLGVRHRRHWLFHLRRSRLQNKPAIPRTELVLQLLGRKKAALYQAICFPTESDEAKSLICLHRPLTTKAIKQTLYFEFNVVVKAPAACRKSPWQMDLLSALWMSLSVRIIRFHGW